MRCAICGSDTDKSTVYSGLIGNSCEYCIKQIRKSRLSSSHEPLPQIIGPQRYENAPTAPVIGIFDGLLLGLRCAKWKHGTDAVTEIIQGFYYEDDHGDQIERKTTEDVPETERCRQCWLALWACNAMEVTV